MSPRRRLRLAALISLAPIAAALACIGSQARLPADAVAGFADRHVTYDDFEGWVVASTGDRTTELPAAALSGLFDQYLDELLLEHRAIELDLVEGRQPQRAARRLLDRFLPEPVSQESIARYHAEHAAEYRRPERVRLRQLLSETRSEAEAAVAEIESGVPFDEVVARRFPDVGERAGWLGELARDELPPELVEAVFATPPGSTTGVLADDTGFHVFYVEALLPAEKMPLSQVEDEIRARLEADARRAQLESLAADARERYNLVLAAERLPFAYQPSRQPSSAAAR